VAARMEGDALPVESLAASEIVSNMRGREMLLGGVRC
jgi:hypothetical protein